MITRSARAWAPRSFSELAAWGKAGEPSPHVPWRRDLVEPGDEAGYDESPDESSRTKCMASLVLSSLAWKAWVPRLVRCSSP